MEWGEARDAQEGTTDLGLHASKPGLGQGLSISTQRVYSVFLPPCPCLSPSRGFMPRGELIPRRSKRMWSITPASSGPCFSPGFMKPTNSQVPPASMPCSLSHSAAPAHGRGRRWPEPAAPVSQAPACRATWSLQAKAPSGPIFLSPVRVCDT